jgi:hypothetical protein
MADRPQFRFDIDSKLEARLTYTELVCNNFDLLAILTTIRQVTQRPSSRLPETMPKVDRSTKPLDLDTQEPAHLYSDPFTASSYHLTNSVQSTAFLLRERRLPNASRP